MLGKPGTTRPVKSSYWAAEWTTMSPWHDRITAMSSMQLAIRGNRSETSMPLWPCFRNVRRVPRSLALLWICWYLTSPNSLGRFWPSSLLSSGLGSKVSRWLGPPAMNRKMTDRAFDGKWAAFAASAETVPARSCSCWSSEARASPPKPANPSRMNSLRVRVGRLCGSGNGRGKVSPDIEEPVQVEDGEGEIVQRLVEKERERRGPFGLGRRTAQGQAERPVDGAGRVAR